MDWLITLMVWIASYIIGAIPFGLVVVFVATGKDVRSIGSGRTGGTNVMRAAGVWAGAVTAILDWLKGGAGVLLAGWLLPGQPWVQVIAGALAVIGSIRSVFLRQRDENGRLHLRGGAGGAACFGAISALWLAAPIILLPLSALIYITIGYASITTLSIAILGTISLMIRAAGGYLPWESTALGFLSIAIVTYALLPNFKRLREGTEREVGLRAWRTKQRQEKENANSQPKRERTQPTKLHQTSPSSPD